MYHYKAKFSGRKMGALGIWQSLTVTFASDCDYALDDPNWSKLAVVNTAAITAAHAAGFEVNHLTAIERA